MELITALSAAVRALASQGVRAHASLRFLRPEKGEGHIARTPLPDHVCEVTFLWGGQQRCEATVTLGLRPGAWVASEGRL